MEREIKKYISKIFVFFSLLWFVKVRKVKNAEDMLMSFKNITFCKYNADFLSAEADLGSHEVIFIESI